jgi:hypothetical protein
MIKIRWDIYKHQQFVLALAKFMAHYPKQRVKRIPQKRKKPEYVFIP